MNKLYICDFSRTCKLNIDGTSEKTKQYLKCLDALYIFNNNFFEGSSHLDARNFINQRMQKYIAECLEGDNGGFATQILEVLELQKRPEFKAADLSSLYSCDLISPDDSDKSGEIITFTRFCLLYRFIE